MSMPGNINLLTIPLVATILMVGTGSSVMMTRTNDMEVDLNQMALDFINWLVQHLKIDNAYGQYSMVHGERVVNRLVLQIAQYVRCSVDLSLVCIELRGSNDLQIIQYSGATSDCRNSGIFTSSVWDESEGGFSVITLVDQDGSVENDGVINGDTVFFAFTLPDALALHQDDSLSITVITGTGATSSIELVVPFVSGINVISFRDM